MQALRDARKTLLDALLADDPRQLVLATATLSLAIGIFLAQRFPVFADPRSYRFMRYLPEDIWATIFIVVGVSKITVCLFNTPLMRSRWRYLPFALNLSTTFLWAVVWAGVYASSPHTVQTVVFFALALAPAWAAGRRFRQAREAALKVTPVTNLPGPKRKGLSR